MKKTVIAMSTDMTGNDSEFFLKRYSGFSVASNTIIIIYVVTAFIK